MDLSDINMEGVKPQSDYQDLPVGQYAVRIEDNERHQAKDKFDESGNKLPPSFFLQLDAKVYGGDHEGHVEKIRMNLWNPSTQAVDIAKQELKSIQDATGTHPRVDPATQKASFNSDWFRGKWMLMDIKPQVKDPSKTTRRYSPATAEMMAYFANLPPVPAKAPTAAAAPVAAVTPGAAAPPPGAPISSATPDWAKKKTA